MADPLNLAGKPFAGYAIESKIGAGGMGVVFRARDERLGRTVAIKILPPELRKDENTRQRFIREGRTAARIDHGNVVRLLAAGEEKGWPYLVMEYVDGGSLQQRIDKYQRLPPAEVISIARQVAAGLGAAHRAGILHRDVKPANVLFDQEGEAKVADFGLAREEHSDVNLSMAGMVMGTPHYMSPEVCEGRKADPRSDLYALGVMMYYMASGVYPFDGEAVMQLLMKHVQEVAPPLEGVPPALSDIVDTLMAKDPAARFQTSDELIAALDAAARNPMEKSSASRATLTASAPRPAVPGSSGIRRPASTPIPAPGSGGLSIPATQLPPLSMAAPLPAPRWHAAAYGVAGVTVLASLGLLVWIFTRPGSDPGANSRGGGGSTDTGKAEQPVDPEILRKGEQGRRWAVFRARALDAGADPIAMLSEAEQFASLDPEGVQTLKTALLARVKEDFLKGIEARQAELVSLAETDVALASAQAQRRGNWDAWPFAMELREAEVAGERRVWDAIFKKTLGVSERLLAAGEFGQAIEAWSKLSPPADQSARRTSEIASLHAAASRAAQEAIDGAARGAEGAKALRVLARRMPKEQADNLEARAFVLESAGANEDPVKELRGFFARRDFEGLLAQVAHLEANAATSRLEPAQLKRLRRIAEAGRRALKLAMDGYRGRLEAKVSLKLSRGGEAAGVMFEVNDDDSGLTLSTKDGYARLRAEQLSDEELVTAAMLHDRSNAACRDILDFAIGCEDGGLVLALARVLTRRSVVLPNDVVQTLLGLVKPETRDRIVAELTELSAILEKGQTDVEKARGMITRYGDFLLRPQDRVATEQALTFGEGPFSPVDLDLFLRGQIKLAADRSVTVSWTDDALLEDVAPWNPYQADMGSDGLALACATPGTFVVTGLQYRSVTVRFEIRIEKDSWFACTTGFRAQHEGHTVLLGCDSDRVGWFSPTVEAASMSPLPQDGWISAEIAVQDTSYTVKVNGVETKGTLLATWPGQVRLTVNGLVTIRKFELQGKPDRVPPGDDKRIRELQAILAEGGELEVPAGSWKKAGSKDPKATLEAERAPEFLEPARWSWGESWVVRFKGRLSGDGTPGAWPEIVLDARTGAPLRRRFYLSGLSRCGFVNGNRWTTAGFCRDLDPSQEHDFALVVDGDWAMLTIDGDVAWTGHPGPAKTGGVAIGVRNGSLTVSDLKIRGLKR